jgi:hypothetical protein
MMALLVVVLILIPFGLLVSLFVSDSVGVDFANHGTKSSLLFAAISTLTRLILFQWMSPFDALRSSQTVMADFLHVLLFPDDLISFPIFTLTEWMGGKVVPVYIWLPYLFVTYFTIFRIIGRFTGGSGPKIPSKRQ